MNESSDCILLVAHDPAIQELVAIQSLEPLGYRVKIAEDATMAILQVAQSAPDLAIVDLNLAGLSGKDLLVAFNSQGLEMPVIVVAQTGQEHKVVQAFRLGGTDYLLMPTREAEVVSAVERALKQVHERRARQRLDQQLKQANQELQRSVRQLTTIFAVGKAVLSTTDQRSLFNKIVEGMVYVADADYGWLLLRDERTRSFTLRAHRNLPVVWAGKMGLPLDDGISSLVALSGESLSIHGEPLKRFKIASLGQAALIIPVKVHQEVIGLLVAVRKADRVFETTIQSLLEAVADYASISIVNTHLFRALQEGSDTALAGEKKKAGQRMELQQEMRSLLQSAFHPINQMLNGSLGTLSPEQRQALKTSQSSLQRAVQLATTTPPAQGNADPHSKHG